MKRDILWAWLVATIMSGIPSTLYAWVTGGDIAEATRAAGAMLVPAPSPLWKLLVAAGIVHAAVSLFWAAVLVPSLPRRHTVAAAMSAAALIALIDLRLVAPSLFPEVAALSFWPQMADHLMWGLSVGATLVWRGRQRQGGESPERAA